MKLYYKKNRHTQNDPYFALYLLIDTINNEERILLRIFERNQEGKGLYQLILNSSVFDYSPRTKISIIFSNEVQATLETDGTEYLQNSDELTKQLDTFDKINDIKLMNKIKQLLTIGIMELF